MNSDLFSESYRPFCGTRDYGASLLKEHEKTFLMEVFCDETGLLHVITPGVRKCVTSCLAGANRFPDAPLIEELQNGIA